MYMLALVKPKSRADFPFSPDSVIPQAGGNEHAWQLIVWSLPHSAPAAASDSLILSEKFPLRSIPQPFLSAVSFCKVIPLSPLLGSEVSGMLQFRRTLSSPLISLPREDPSRGEGQGHRRARSSRGAAATPPQVARPRQVGEAALTDYGKINGITET